MDTNDLKKAQAREIFERLRPTLGYLSRLVNQLDSKHFPTDDKLRLAMIAALNAMQSLTMELQEVMRDGMGEVA